MIDIQKVQHGNVLNAYRGPNPHLQILGIVPCMVQGTNISRGVISKTREDYPGLVLPIEIKLLVDFVNSTLEGVPLIIAKPQHPGAIEYMELVTMLLNMLEGNDGEK